jgi:hypothetical protein
MRTERVLIPTTTEHALYAIVSFAGHAWVVADIDEDTGVTVLERAITDSPEDIPIMSLDYRTQRWGWPPVIIAICAVFLFIACVASIGHRLTFTDVVGIIVGFVVLVLLLDRREDTRPPAREKPYRNWWVL